MHQESPTGEVDTQDLQDQGAGNTSDANDGAVSSTAASAQDANQSELDLDAVIRKAAEEAGQDAEDSSTDGKDKQGDKPADDGEAADPPEKTPEEQAAEQEAADAKLPFHKHPRWQEVKRERDQFRAKAEELSIQVDQLSGKAQQLDTIGSFMREHELTAEEVQQGFEIMALMKHDPAAALQKLAPHLSNLELAAGQRLPEDLQAKVDAGEVTPEIARETARARMEAAAARYRAERAGHAIEQTNAQQLVTAMKDAVTGWENDVKARDPDYPHMQSFVLDRTRVLMAQKPPRTPDDAKALVKQAYDEVKAQMKRVLPQRQPMRTVTSDKSSTTAVAAPNSLTDVVKMALRG